MKNLLRKIHEKVHLQGNHAGLEGLAVMTAEQASIVYTVTEIE